MKNNKLIPILLALILLLTPTAAVYANSTEVAPVSAAATFTPRLSAPSASNSYYYSNKNIFYSIGYGMPNCTAYAWGRAYEILKTRPNLSLDSAHYWYNYNKTNKYYPYGQTPKLGAIACWNNPYGGHVAVVEKIENGMVTLSHSAWGGPNFYTTTYPVGDKSAGIYSSGWSFYGYIYILDAASATPDVGDIYRITSGDGVNLRKGAGTSYSVITAIPYNTDITVTEYKIAGGYTWGKTTYNGGTGWCVLDYAKLIKDNPKPALPSEKPAITPTEATTTPVVTAAPIETTTVPMEPLEPTTVPAETSFSTVPKETQPSTGGLVTTPVTEPSLPPEITSFPDNIDIPVTPDKRGDANGDGVINIKDANLIQKYVAKTGAGLVELVLEQADVNSDGKITILDATCLQKQIAKVV